jgi:hypothetical protein
MRPLIAIALALAPACGGSEEGAQSDGPGCPGFATIVDTTFQQGDPLVWRLTVAELPAQLTFNQEDVPESRLEYRWGANVDVEGDGVEDYLVAISHFTFGEQVAGDILGNTQQNLWQIDGATKSAIADIDASIEATTFVMSVPVAAAMGLAGIGAPSRHRFETYYTGAAGTCSDER